MGALVSKMNGCECCTRTHAGVAALAYQNEEKVSAALFDIETAPLDEPLRATLRMLRRLTRERTLTAHDVQTALAVSVSREQIESALAVCFTFNTVDRLSRTFGYVVPSQKAFNAGAKFLLKRGYRAGQKNVMSSFAAARDALVFRILEGDGMASHALRRAAFDNRGLPEPLATLGDKIVKHTHRVTDDNITAALSSGLTEDQLFEFTVCAAVGEATRQDVSGRAALMEAGVKRDNQKY
jgi:alkylhydroperoxidase family enzyme